MGHPLNARVHPLNAGAVVEHGHPLKSGPVGTLPGVSVGTVRQTGVVSGETGAVEVGRGFAGGDKGVPVWDSAGRTVGVLVGVGTAVGAGDGEVDADVGSSRASGTRRVRASGTQREGKRGGGGDGVCTAAEAGARRLAEDSVGDADIVAGVGDAEGGADWAEVHGSPSAEDTGGVG